MRYNRRTSFLLIAAAIFSGITGCQPIYAPPPAFVPMLNEKDDAAASVSFSTIGDGPLTAQGAFAPINHLMFVASGTLTPHSSDSLYTRASSMSMGAGYFTAFNHPGRLALYGGWGLGHVDFVRDESPTEPSFLFGLPVSAKTDYYSGNINYRQYFGEADIGWTHEQYMFGVALRLTGLDYYDYDAMSTHHQSSYPFQIQVANLLRGIPLHSLLIKGEDGRRYSTSDYF